MPTATTTPTTSRRSALRGFGLATLAAGLAVPALAIPSSADADLIRQCDRIVAIRARLDAVYAIRNSIEAEERTEPELDLLYDEQRAICERIESLPALSTATGAQAMARASLALAELEFDGSVRWDGGEAERLAGDVVAFLAKGDLA